MIRCIPYGDRAMLVNFDQQISEAINQQVNSTKSAMENVQGITYLIPAYCSLTIGFNSEIISYDALQKQVEKKTLVKKKAQKGRKLAIPVCYGGDFGPDMSTVVSYTQLSEQEIIKLHTTKTYSVFMMGFIPGFAYMGKLSDALQCKRQEEPRRNVPKGSVGLAGLQTGIYPSDAPGGWQLIGKTPVDTFLANNEEPFLFNTGDEVSFYSISAKSYKQIKADIKNNQFNPESLYE